VIGSLFVAESPRWLFAQGKPEQAYAALLRSRTQERADLELAEMRQTLLAKATNTSGKPTGGSLLQRRYVFPFLLACTILFCNTATGVNSLIGYNTSILLQSGLSDVYAHWGYVVFTFINFATTIGGMALVDRKGRRFLFILGTVGLTVCLICIGLLFLKTERLSLECNRIVQSMVGGDQTLTLTFDAGEADKLLTALGYLGSEIKRNHASLAVIYSYGGFTAATSFVRSDDRGATPIQITREACVPTNKVEAFFKNPFANLDAARTAPLKIDRALIGQIPDARNGWLVAAGLYLFIAFYALGPGVCVWLALSELMPTRIRSNGMSIALVINQLVATTLAGIFLPVVSKCGYSTMFFIFSGFGALYLMTVTFFLPETKGKTLEEIAHYFETASGQ